MKPFLTLNSLERIPLITEAKRPGGRISLRQENKKKKERKVNKLIERQRERESEAVKAMLIRAGIQ